MNTQEGVYFRREEYASFWVRVLVDLIDLTAFTVVSLLLTLPVLIIFPIDRTLLNVVLSIWLTLALSYFCDSQAISLSHTWVIGSHRQALRDKFAKTYVVKANSQPAGHGRTVFRYYSICGQNWLFQEVEAPLGQTNGAPNQKLGTRNQ